MSRRPSSFLSELARLYGIQLSYKSPLTGDTVRAMPDSILGVLRALGAPVTRVEDCEGALRQALEVSRHRVLEPVVAIRAERIDSFGLSPGRGERPLRCAVLCEDGRSLRWDLPTDRREAVAGRIELPQPLPPGYHRLTVETTKQRHEALLITSPGRCHGAEGDRRFWGVFIPLYALGGRSSLRAGSLADLDRLVEWVGSQGGSVVATLPMLASFLDEPFEPSPYAPVSRLFWNELFLDIEALPEFHRCSRARRIAGSSGIKRELRSMARSPLVDYRRAARLRRRVLSEMAAFFFSRSSPDRAALRRTLRSSPELMRYARFRAVCENRNETWHRWPARLRNGLIRRGDHDDVNRLYHLYVQWRTDQQIEVLSRKATGHGKGLYLDFPLGVHPDGYDVWREQDLFARGASVGAPPDAFFSKGQNWGFPPIHPEAARAGGYGYFRECLRRHMSRAGVLRMDHILGFHRSFWIPEGMPASEGVYVKHRSEELYSILSLESNRTRTLIVGEDLGAVPRELRPAMRRRGVQRTFVMQYELGDGRRSSLPDIPESCIASLNTHDMPTFASFLGSGDLDEAMALGLLSSSRVRSGKRRRQALLRSLVKLLRRAGHLTSRRPGRRQMLKALITWMASSRARGLILNLEDLWGEECPQNTPGTTDERPNWRRKARYDLRGLARQPDVLAMMRLVDRHRQETRT